MPVHRHRLQAPATWSPRGKRAFLAFARALSQARAPDNEHVVSVKQRALSLDDPGLAAAVHVLNDLAHQGWPVYASDGNNVDVGAPASEADPAAEKQRVRRQELLKREEQLLTPSVRRFIAEMERPREFNGRFVSIFNLMRDGSELADSLRQLADKAQDRPPALRSVIDPYVQVIRDAEHERCTQTGLRLVDVWRYFRHTWTNQYTSTPGRTMLILVRDRAAEFEPVIGIAALASAIVQISERDQWIGWRSDEFLTSLEAKPSLAMAKWLDTRLDRGLAELYLDDLLEDGLYWPSLWESPDQKAIDRLVKEAEHRRRDHHRFVRGSKLKSSVRDWRERAQLDLFRSKRCLALADLLRARMALAPFLEPVPTLEGLRRALADAAARRAIAGLLRRAKSESVGTEIADLTVCGAVAPYNSLLGGKLVSMLAVSPSVVRAYHDRYRSYASEIASSLAGRPIQRRSHLVFVGTTSLYGSGSSQYSRVRIPGHVLGGESDIVFQSLGKSRSFGTSHLSNASVTELVRLAQQSSNGVRVNSIFGEGVNPKLRKVRAGFDLLGWPADELLQHRRPRIVYGVSLVSNLLPYLIGKHKQPRYLFRRGVRSDVEAISAWWMERWLAGRITSDDVLARVASNRVDRPVEHEARVILPALPSADEQEDSL